MAERIWEFGYFGYEYTEDDLKRNVGKGWHKLLDKVFNFLPEHTVILDIKEKWGGLRIYLLQESDEVFQFLQDIEEESLVTCELCGDTGKPVLLNGWWKTLCEKCWRENE